MERLFVYQMDYCRGLQRVSPGVLARLASAQPRAQPSLRAASGTGGVVVGNLSNRARSGDRNTNDTIDILGRVPPGPGRPDNRYWMLWASERPSPLTVEYQPWRWLAGSVTGP